MNQTIIKYGHPSTLVADYAHWVVLVRQKQITAACMILACKEEATCFPEISPQAFGELKIVMHDIELNLRRMVHFDKINYLALMMVDPHVHFHVVPRYAGERKFGTLDIPDRGWPKHPDLSSVHEISGVEFEKFCVETRAQWIRTTASA